MKRVQDKWLDYALGLETRSALNRGTEKKLIFRKSQIHTLERVGLISRAIAVEDSDRYVARHSTEVDTILIRRSMLMNLVSASYRYTRIQRAQKFFNIAVNAHREVSK